MTHPLNALFEPRSLALVGASESADSLGYFVLQNIRQGGFSAPCFAVNPKHRVVCGLPCFASLLDLPQSVDLAVIAAPAAATAQILEEAGQRGIPAAVILSSGFGAKTMVGRTLQKECLAIARAQGIRVLGPNCLGLARPPLSLNATFARARANPGKVALISQSGALCAAMLDLAAEEDFGFSSVISLGAAADVDFGEILDYLREDQATEAILLYVEGIHDAAAFMHALRETARLKPIIIMKSGRYASGSQAASSHTGALVGRDEVFDAALRRCGAVRVFTYTQLIAAARILSSARDTRSDRLGILSNGGGLAVIAADSAMQNDIALAQLSINTIDALDRVLPSTWSHANPIDIVGDAPAARFGAAVKEALHDESIDALLVLYCPTVPADPVACAQAVADVASAQAKPVLTVWLESKEARSCGDIFEAAGVPHFSSPEEAVEAFSFLAAYRRNQKLLHRAPAPYDAISPINHEAYYLAEALYARARAEGRTLFSEHEAKSLLRAFGLPAARTILAKNRGEALAAAEDIGYPVALKILSPDLTHKSDVGGVRLSLQNAAMLASAFEDMLAHVRHLRPEARIDGALVQAMLRFEHAREVLIGVATDPIFGRVISFGAGGVAVEALHDTAIGLPPLDNRLARELMSATRIHRVLGPYRNIPGVDLSALAEVLVKVSQMTDALPWLAEMDLNPVLAHPGGATIADARIVIAPQDSIRKTWHARNADSKAG